MVKSRLLELLEKNAYGQGLSNEEIKEAKRLIAKAKPGTEECWVCKMIENSRQSKAIYDTGICKSHAYYALITKK